VLGLPVGPPARGSTPSLRLRIALLAALAVSGLGVWAEAPASAQTPAPAANRDLTLVPGGKNAAFDEQTLRLIASRADVVTIKAAVQAGSGGRSYAEIVRRLKELNPSLTVLIYALSVTFVDNANIEAEILRPIYEEHPEWVLAYRSSNRTYVGDVRNPDFRAAVIDATAEMVERVGADGVFFDHTKLSPEWILPERSGDEEFVADYKEGMRSFLREARQQMQPRLTYFNGLKNQPNVRLADQRELLGLADGAFIEAFGSPVSDDSFQTDILPYLQAVPQHPDKWIGFFGRSIWNYESYRADYLRQRYYYAAYLMVKSALTSFQQVGQFNISNRIIETDQRAAEDWRSFGAAVYWDQDLDLGQPVQSYEVRNGVYTRPFTNGLVLMVPKGIGQTQYQLDRTYYTPEGSQVAGSLTVSGGQGWILLNSRPPPPASVPVRIDANSSAIASSAGVSVRQSDGRRYLRFARQTDGLNLQDMRLDDIRTLDPARRLQVQLRTSDSGARLLLMAEVDDSQAQYNRVVVELAPGRSSSSTGTGAYPYYRDRNGQETLPYIRLPTSWSANGRWATIYLEPSTLGSRYTFRRWEMARPVGNLDLAELTISRSSGD
jgi:Hypothetical glycosyl hydrolase family 15